MQNLAVYDENEVVVHDPGTAANDATVPEWLEQENNGDCVRSWLRLITILGIVNAYIMVGIPW